MRLSRLMHRCIVAAKCRVLGPIQMNFANCSDETLLHYYESVRRQVTADKQSGGRYRLAGANVRAYADRLKDEIDRRQLRFKPIDW
jgi:hypothetical protein